MQTPAIIDDDVARSRGGFMLRTLLIGMLCGLSTVGVDTRAQGAYFAASPGRSQWDIDCVGGPCDRTATAIRLATGYRFKSVAGVEAFYLDLGKARSPDSSNLAGELGARAVGVVATLGGLVGDVELAGKIGLASVRADYRASPASSYPSKSRSQTELVGGAMLVYRFTPNLGLRFDLDILTVTLDGEYFFYYRGADVTTVSLGLAYRF